MEQHHHWGFTIIELIIVVAIISILAAIAIPQFAQYRIKGYNASALSDVRNIRMSEEALMAACKRYGRSAASALPGPGGNGPGAVLTGPGLPALPDILTLTDEAGASQGIQTPAGNGVTLVASTDADSLSYTAATKHLNGTLCYGVDSDSTRIYQNDTLRGPGAAIQPGDEQVPAADSDQFASVAGWR